MGVKKSTVWIRANSSESLYTAASSQELKPTSSSVLFISFRFPIIWARNSGRSLDAQPAAEAQDVNLFVISSSPDNGLRDKKGVSNTTSFIVSPVFLCGLVGAGYGFFHRSNNAP